jgi:hypothetical protein
MIDNNHLIRTHLLFKFIYSTIGLILGFLSIIAGAYLFIRGITGQTQFSATIFGNNTSLTDAAPGTILFIVGLFLVIVTRYTKVKLKTNDGGNFVGAPVQPSDDSPRIDDNKYKYYADTIDANAFLLFYTKIITHYRFYRDDRNVGEILRLYLDYPENQPEKVIYKALCDVYEYDKKEQANNVCHVIFSNHEFKNDEINEILKKGIWDLSKSNRLRERFFWAWSHINRQEALQFYNKNLIKFLHENKDNDEICSEIIGSMHWYINKKGEGKKQLLDKTVIDLKDILNSRPNLWKGITTSIEKKLLESYGITNPSSQ